MRDCPNAQMRDRLPDLLHDRLTGAELERVRAHVASCDACRSEIELLLKVRHSFVAPSVDAAGIAARLPAYRVASPWERALRSPAARIAAAVVLLAGGSVLAVNTVRSVRDRPAAVAIIPAPTELAVGETLSDISDSDLLALLNELSTLEAVTPSETDVVVVPAIGRGGA